MSDVTSKNLKNTKESKSLESVRHSDILGRNTTVAELRKVTRVVSASGVDWVLIRSPTGFIVSDN